MKKWLVLAALLIGIGVATPAMAGHHGHYRGRSVRGGYHSRPVSIHRYPRYGAGAYCRVGGPRLAVAWYAPAFYAPSPAVYYDLGYYEPVWVPGHYVRGGGARIWVGGYWSR